MDGKRQRIRRLLWALVALGFAAALVSARARWRVEAQNRRVEITLDYAELRALAAQEGVPLPEALARFRAAGATSVAVTEDTVGSLEGAGRVTATALGRGGTLLRVAPGDGGEAAPLGERIAGALRAKTRHGVAASDGSRGGVLRVDQPFTLVGPLGVGLDPEAVAQVRAAGLGVVGRVQNWEGVRPDGIRWTLGRLKEQGVSTVIFSGDEVLGFRGFVADDPHRPGQASTETALRDLGLFFGAVEFVKQRGDALLARAAQDRTVRVHTISGAEMLAADIPSNVQRFLLAARERNIRLAFVRVFPELPGALEANAVYVEKIAAGLRRAALVAGSAHGYDPLRTSPALRLLMGLGLAAAWCLLLDSLTLLLAPGGTGALRALAAGGGLALAALAAAPGTTGPKLAALAAACLYPALALVHTDLLRPAGQGLAPGAALSHAVRGLLAASGITLLGAATVVGLLAERAFLIKADAFAGIKLAQLVPLVLAAGVYALGLWATPERPWPRVAADARERIATLGREPVLLWQAALALAALVALLLLVLRSGNDPGVGVSPLELRVRGLLDRLLYARPRFKEFLIGHPAMIVALGLAVTGRRGGALPLFLAGAIGQVSLLNTFCHLHTPLLVSLVRALLGLVIGVIIGAVAYVFIDRLTRRAGAAVAGARPAARALRVR